MYVCVCMCYDNNKKTNTKFDEILYTFFYYLNM